MHPRSLMFALALVASPFAFPAPGLASTSSTALFDSEVAAGLPRSFYLPGDDLPGDGTARKLDVLERLDVELEAPDGGSGTMFLAEVDGQPATIVRMGDALDIAFDEKTEQTPSRQRTKRSTDWPVDYAGASDLFFPPSDDAEPTERQPDRAQENELRVWIFLHDDAGEDNHAKVLNWYAAGWIREMTTEVKPGLPVRVTLKARIQGVTDFDYHASDSRADRLADFRQVADDYVQAQGGTAGRFTKHVLLVGEPASNWAGRSFDTVLGVAQVNGHSAFVSNHGHRHNFAHEVGHMIGATHEDAAVYLLHVSNMGNNLVGKFSNQQYTGANRQNIRNFFNARL